jgi:hypothetical protein
MFYSGLVSSAQRLPNGNTMITEGVGGRIFEVTKEHEMVWEYVNPYRGWNGSRPGGRPSGLNMVYRAYRVPYAWVPQVTRPEEIAIKRVDNSRFRVPGSPRSKARRTTSLKIRRRRTASEEQACVIPKNIQDRKPET